MYLSCQLSWNKREISLRSIVAAKIGQHRGGCFCFGFVFSSEYFVTTYLKQHYFSSKFHFELKLFSSFQREERTEIRLTRRLLSSRHLSIARPDQLCLIFSAEVLVQSVFNNY